MPLGLEAFGKKPRIGGHLTSLLGHSFDQISGSSVRWPGEAQSVAPMVPLLPKNPVLGAAVNILNPNHHIPGANVAEDKFNDSSSPLLPSYNPYAHSLIPPLLRLTDGYKNFDHAPYLMISSLSTTSASTCATKPLTSSPAPTSHSRRGNSFFSFETAV